MKSLPSLAAFCLSTACLIGGVSAGPIKYQDDFERSASDAGQPLALQNVGKSQTPREATANLVLGDGGGVKVTDQNAFVGRLALPPNLKEITIEAKINPVPVAGKETDGSNWMSIGMGNSPLASPSFGGLFLLVRAGGVFSLMYNPEADDPRSANAVAIKSGKIKTWNPDGLNEVKLVFNKESDEVSAFANGDEMLIEGLSLKEKNFSPECSFAGFSGIWQSSEVRSIGSFNATIETK